MRRTCAALDPTARSTSCLAAALHIAMGGSQRRNHGQRREGSMLHRNSELGREEMRLMTTDCQWVRRVRVDKASGRHADRWAAFTGGPPPTCTGLRRRAALVPS
jgi:hypothetical protein